MTDPISDMLTRIRNAKAVEKPMVSVPFSKMKMSVASVLAKEGFIDSCSKKGKKTKKTIEIKLKYDAMGNSRISDLKRVSKPGQRIYKGYSELFDIKQGMGIAVVSTPEGVLTGKEARKKKIGGEVLCLVW